MPKVHTINPFTGETIQEWEQMDFSLMTAGTIKARSAFTKWRQVAVAERVEKIRLALDYFEDNREIIAKDITCEMYVSVLPTDTGLKL